MPRDVYIHVSGIDLIRGRDGTYYVLEDNLRTPSGISYVLENRDVLKRSFPRLFEHYQPLPVDDYPRRLLDALRHSAPDGNERTDGRAAHARDLQLRLFRAHHVWPGAWASNSSRVSDLLVHDNIVYMKTTKGLQRVDVIYRRIDDEYHRPARIPRRLNARGRRLDECVSLGQRRAWPTPSAPASPTTRRSTRSFRR